MNAPSTNRIIGELDGRRLVAASAGASARVAAVGRGSSREARTPPPGGRTRRLRRAAVFFIMLAGTVAAVFAPGYWMAPAPAPGQPAPPIAQRIQAGLAELDYGLAEESVAGL